jgi:hypothetical protein
VSRQDLDDLRKTIQSLKDDLDSLKVQDKPKEPSPDQQLWESRRTECGDNVIRNIDYQHVLVLHSIDNRASPTRNSGHQLPNNSGKLKHKNGKITSQT